MQNRSYNFKITKAATGEDFSSFCKKQKPVNEKEAKILSGFSMAGLTQAKAELCKRSFYYFVKEFWSTIIPEAPVWNWHIEYLCNELQEVGFRIANRQKKKSDILVNVPPGTSKTSICSIMYPVWLWVVDDTIKIIAGSYAKELSTTQATKSRDIVNSEKFKTYFPHISIKEDQNNKLNYETKRGGARITTSTGSAVTGQHAHIIIIDDPQNPELANSEAEREITNRWVSETLSTRKIDSDITVTVIVQQRLHNQDVTGYLLSKGKEYHHICLPAEQNQHIKPAFLVEKYIFGLLDPVRLRPEVLIEKKIDLGTRAYNTQINQNPQDDADSIIKEIWFSNISQHDFQEIIKERPPVIDFYVDTAFKDKRKSDYSAILACCKIGELLYVTGIAHVKMELPKLIPFLKTWTSANSYTGRSRIFIEPAASGLSVFQVLKSESSFNAVESKANKSGKIERLNAISPKVEAGKVILVQGGWNKLFLSEVTCNDPVNDDVRDCFVAAVEGKLVSSKTKGQYKIW
jgi:hypothetical protein